MRAGPRGSLLITGWNWSAALPAQIRRLDAFEDLIDIVPALRNRSANQVSFIHPAVVSHP